MYVYIVFVTIVLVRIGIVDGVILICFKSLHLIDMLAGIYACRSFNRLLSINS